jgi:class 3 adenylate cyclase
LELVKFNKRSLAILPIAIIQTAVGWATIAICVGLFILFGLQFPHSSKLDTVWLVTHLRFYGDPILGEIAPYLNSKWPLNSVSFVPLAVALGVWVAKLVLNLGFTQVRRGVAKLVPVEKGKGARATGSLMEETEIAGADTAEAREQLLKRYREIEGKLKSAKRKRCSFLSIDIVGSTQMKVGERETEISATFQAYEEMLKKIFKQYGAWKDAWTPDGVMVCFLQADLAVAAGVRILQRLKKFNEHDNKLRTPFRVRCGINEGEVQIFEDSKLEKVADRVIDVAGHMQKEANSNAIWLSEEVFNILADKSDFRETEKVVDGLKVFEWSLEAPPPAAKPAPAKPAVRTAAAPSPIVAATADVEATQDGVLRRIGRYEILNELGRGAMGAVYQARDPQIGRIVAIKVIMVGNQPAEVLDDYKQRFYREAQTAGQMSHPGIVTIYDMAESEDGNPYLVMEFVEGTTLDKLLAPKKPGESLGPGPMSLKQKLDIAAQVADALDYAHRRKVIHRDIKPANILVTPEGKAKIADFGIAKMAGTQMTHTGLLVGTPAFMSPEQITGSEIDSRSDIFSFGVLAYWMLTGKRPFPGDAITQIAYKVVHAPPVPIRELNPDLPTDIEPVIFKCLAKKVDDRYATARDLAADLEALKARQTLASANLPTPSAG